MSDNSDSGNSRDILIQAPNWLGDVVMSTPLLAWLDARRERPDGTHIRLHLGIRREWAPLFTDDPRLEGLLIYDRTGVHGGLRGIPRQVRDVKKGRYDAVLVGPPSLRAALVAALAGIPRRVGRRGDGRDLLLTDPVARRVRGTLHYSREMLELGGRLLEEAVDDEPASGVSLPGCDAMDPVDHGPGPAVLAVAPGTTYGEAKTWPVKRVAEFMNLALAQDRWRVVLLGDSLATGFVRKLKDEIPGIRAGDFSTGAKVADLTGQTNLTEVVRVLRGCSGFVGNDSGLMHLAAALGVPTVGVFGSSNPDWTAPLGRAAVPVTARGYDCRPCYRKTCNQPRFCLEDVAADTVLEALGSVTDQPIPPKGGA